MIAGVLFLIGFVATCEMATVLVAERQESLTEEMGGLPAVLQSFYRWMAEV